MKPKSKEWAVDTSYDGYVWYPISQGFKTEEIARQVMEQEKTRYPASLYRLRLYDPPEVVRIS